MSYQEDIENIKSLVFRNLKPGAKGGKTLFQSANLQKFFYSLKEFECNWPL